VISLGLQGRTLKSATHNKFLHLWPPQSSTNALRTSIIRRKQGVNANLLNKHALCTKVATDGMISQLFKLEDNG